MIRRSRRLRRETSFPERLLWSRLRNGRCGGLKFRRQQPLGPYVADFFCASAATVIELDGRSHDEQGKPDKDRQDYLRQRGLSVIRFTNDQVLANLDGVVEAIMAACVSQPFPDTLTLPSPLKGEA